MTTQKRSFLQANVDFLNGPILQSLIIFAVPIFISAIFQQLYNTCDTMIVGKFLGDNSLAAIGSCSAIFDLFVGFGNGIGGGLALVTGRAFGSGDRELLKKSVAASIVIGVVSSLLLSLIGFITLRPLLNVLGTPAEILEEAYSYIILIAAFLIVMFAYNTCAGMMRAIGNSVMPLVFLIISSLFNIALDTAFIGYMNMGVRGAAIATVIAQGISVLFCIVYIKKKVEILVPEKRHFELDKKLYKEMIAQGYAMGFMSSIVSIGSVTLQRGINLLGTETIAGHGVARKIYMFFNMPFIAMGQSVSAFIAQNRGAQQPKRIVKALKQAYVYSVCGAAVVTLILLPGARPLVQFISSSTADTVVNNATRYLHVVGPFYAVLGILMSTRFALQAIGEKGKPIISSVIECVSKIAWAFIFIPMFKYEAVIWCEPLIWCIMTVQLLYSLWTNKYIKDAMKEA